MNHITSTNLASIQPGKRQSRPVLVAAVGLVMGLASATVLAQGVYRIVGPDGRVTYSDQPQPDQASARSIDNAAKTVAASANNAPLPFALRQVVSRYPVTLYTSTDCAPCNHGRNLLHSRGVPYVEKTINTQQDAEALQRISGATSLPFLTIGTQQIKGYSDTEWTQFIDAAGYPRQSILPANYQRPAASPLVAVETPVVPSPTVTPRQNPVETVVPVSPPIDNPAGIRF